MGLETLLELEEAPSKPRDKTGGGFSAALREIEPACPLIIPCEARKSLIFSRRSMTLFFSFKVSLSSSFFAKLFLLLRPCIKEEASSLLGFEKC